jgi:hypothetical protein
MRFRKLRIAWSVFWSAACVLLIVLWVRSYSFNDLLHRIDASGWMIGINSDTGTSALIYAPLSSPPTQGMAPRGWFLQTTRTVGSGIGFGLKVGNGVVYVAARYWMIALAITTVAAIPWFRFRFGLRFMLIATTLVGVALGLAICAVGK